MKLGYHLSWTNFVTALISLIEWSFSVYFIVYSLLLLSLSYIYPMITPVIVIQISYVDISSCQYAFEGTLFTAPMNCRKSVIQDGCYSVSVVMFTPGDGWRDAF